MKPTIAKDKMLSKAAVTDMTFFGAPPPSAAPKPKSKLPDVKKREPSAAPPPPPSASGPSSLLSATMSQLFKKADSPASGLVPSINAEQPPERKPKLNRKGHTVRFKDTVPDGGDLVSVREFVRPDYEKEAERGDASDDVHGMSTHQLDMDEGKALRAHEGIEEIIEWYDPESASATSHRASSLPAHPSLSTKPSPQPLGGAAWAYSYTFLGSTRQAF